MHLHYDAETERFRAELRDWLAEHQSAPDDVKAEPVTSSAHLTGWSRRWQRRLFDAGLLVPGWPPELGGRSLTPVQQLVYYEEMAKLTVEVRHVGGGSVGRENAGFRRAHLGCTGAPCADHIAGEIRGANT